MMTNKMVIAFLGVALFAMVGRAETDGPLPATDTGLSTQISAEVSLEIR
jgi:hypothetical protein